MAASLRTGMMMEKRMGDGSLPGRDKSRPYELCPGGGAAGGEGDEGVLRGVGLGRAYSGVEGAEGHDASGGGVVEAAALDAAHVDVAFVHEGFDEEGERLATGPERGVGADMGPEGFHQFEAAADV